ncbi:MAG TPA: hypothetical protein VFX25_09880 [Streptosporangiaceae bacterium]|nr:hypothetical protein [Streptosporangiaceae bacterium]
MPARPRPHIGAAWPAACEQAAVGYFERMLGADLGLRGSNNLA